MPSQKMTTFTFLMLPTALCQDDRTVVPRGTELAVCSHGGVMRLALLLLLQALLVTRETFSRYWERASCANTVPLASGLLLCKYP